MKNFLESDLKFMIVDFHTHSFPADMAGRAIARLSVNADMAAHTDGTLNGLRQSMEEASIDCSVLMPVCTSPAQTAKINRLAIETCEEFPRTGILSFGGIHPDNSDYRTILRNLAEHQIRGIKLHPVFQKTNLDDLRFLRIIDCASENGLIVLTHGGYDISFPGQDQASPQRIRNVWTQLHPRHLVAAHLGGWGVWKDALELLADTDIFLDTSTCLTPRHRLLPYDPSRSLWKPEEEQIPVELFREMVRVFGADRFLMASDSPWTSQKESVDAIQTAGLSPAETDLILGKNAAGLLKL